MNGSELNLEGDSSDPEQSVSLKLSCSPMGSIENFEDLTVDNVQKMSNGDIIVDNELLLSVPQRLLLDQQLRQHVQILTQQFLQSHQHPVHSEHASHCKKFLVRTINCINVEHLSANSNVSSDQSFFLSSLRSL